MDVQALLLTSGRAVAVYVLMLVVVRALGKRTVGNFSAFDLLVALMLGEIVDEMIYGDVRFIQGTVAMVTIGGRRLRRLSAELLESGHGGVLEGTPTLVVKRGEFHRSRHAPGTDVGAGRARRAAQPGRSRRARSRVRGRRARRHA